MYRIDVLSAGKYNNVVLGPRYCLFKRTAKRLVNEFSEVDCSLRVSKFIRCSDDVFCWSGGEVEDEIVENLLYI
jgi:hypothetical protein